MKTKRRREIKKETYERTIIRFPAHRTQIFCPVCAAPVSHIKVGQAASALTLSEMTIFRLAESGQLHATESSGGSLLLCGNSLAEWGKEINTFESKKVKE